MSGQIYVALQSYVERKVRVRHVRGLVTCLFPACVCDVPVVVGLLVNVFYRELCFCLT